MYVIFYESKFIMFLFKISKHILIFMTDVEILTAQFLSRFVPMKVYLTVYKPWVMPQINVYRILQIPKRVRVLII